MGGAQYWVNCLLVPREPTNRSYEIPWTWHKRQPKERARFLVSRSLTLSSTHVHTVGGSRHNMMNFPACPKKIAIFHNKKTFKLRVGRYLLQYLLRNGNPRIEAKPVKRYRGFYNKNMIHSYLCKFWQIICFDNLWLVLYFYKAINKYVWDEDRDVPNTSRLICNHAMFIVGKECRLNGPDN